MQSFFWIFHKVIPVAFCEPAYGIKAFQFPELQLHFPIQISENMTLPAKKTLQTPPKYYMIINMPNGRILM